MFKRMFGKSQFVKMLNPLLEQYAENGDVHTTYRELRKIRSLARTKGEKALYDLNRACLLYDMGRLKEAADVVSDIPHLNQEMDAKTAQIKVKIRKAMNEGVYS